jgi:transposase
MPWRAVTLLTRGHTNLEIAATLVISVHTVERHLQNAYRKVGVRNRADAAYMSARPADAAASQASAQNAQSIRCVRRAVSSASRRRRSSGRGCR